MYAMNAFTTAHHWYSQLLAMLGRYSEAFAEIETGSIRDLFHQT
jgi:hypothetical protein